MNSTSPSAFNASYLMIPSNYSNYRQPSQQSNGARPSQNFLYSSRALQNMNCIVPATQDQGALYLGDVISLLKADLISQHKIQAVLTCMAQQGIFLLTKLFIVSPISHSAIISHKKISIHDSLNQPIQMHFRESFEFIQKSRDLKQNILVHCHAGVSRSATIVCAYLMQKNKWTPEQAITYVKEKRHRVKPNMNFQQRLIEFYNNEIKQKGDSEIGKENLAGLGLEASGIRDGQRQSQFGSPPPRVSAGGSFYQQQIKSQPLQQNTQPHPTQHRLYSSPSKNIPQKSVAMSIATPRAQTKNSYSQKYYYPQQQNQFQQQQQSNYVGSHYPSHSPSPSYPSSFYHNNHRNVYASPSSHSNNSFHQHQQRDDYNNPNNINYKSTFNKNTTETGSEYLQHQAPTVTNSFSFKNHNTQQRTEYLPNRAMTSSFKVTANQQDKIKENDNNSLTANKDQRNIKSVSLVQSDQQSSSSDYLTKFKRLGNTIATAAQNFKNQIIGKKETSEDKSKQPLFATGAQKETGTKLLKKPQKRSVNSTKGGKGYIVARNDDKEKGYQHDENNFQDRDRENLEKAVGVTKSQPINGGSYGIYENGRKVAPLLYQTNPTQTTTTTTKGTVKSPKYSFNNNTTKKIDSYDSRNNYQQDHQQLNFNNRGGVPLGRFNHFGVSNSFNHQESVNNPYNNNSNSNSSYYHNRQRDASGNKSSRSPAHISVPITAQQQKHSVPNQFYPQHPHPYPHPQFHSIQAQLEESGHFDGRGQRVLKHSGIMNQGNNRVRSNQPFVMTRQNVLNQGKGENDNEKISVPLIKKQSNISQPQPQPQSPSQLPSSPVLIKQHSHKPALTNQIKHQLQQEQKQNRRQSALVFASTYSHSNQQRQPHQVQIQPSDKMHYTNQNQRLDKKQNKEEAL